MEIYALTSCIGVIGFTFSRSVLVKLQDFPQFVATIRGLRLLPDSTVSLVSLLILGLELLVIALLCTSSRQFGFHLASALLLIFSLALASALYRGLQIGCNCFGVSQQPLSSIVLVRNAGFLFCSCSGSWLTTRVEANLTIASSYLEITGFVVLIFTLLVSQLSEIYQIFHRS